MLDELQWPELQEQRQQASFTFFYKTHNNLVTTDKNRYLSEAGNMSTISHPFRITDQSVIFCLINQVPFSGVVPKGLDIQILPIVVSKFPKLNIFSQNENNLHNKIRLRFFLSALTDPRILSLTLKIKQKKVALAAFCFNQKLLCHSDLKSPCKLTVLIFFYPDKSMYMYL